MEVLGLAAAAAMAAAVALEVDQMGFRADVLAAAVKAAAGAERAVTAVARGLLATAALSHKCTLLHCHRTSKNPLDMARCAPYSSRATSE